MSRRRRKLLARHRSEHAILARFALLTIAAALLVALLGASGTYAVLDGWLSSLPDYTSATAFRLPQATRVYSADDKLIARLYLQNRDVVPLSQVATSLADGVVSIEDERFYEHGGVDPIGIVRAIFSTANGDVQGASTITQQVVRNTVLQSERTDRTLKRKVREAFLAEELEKEYTKPQILEMYLNTIYFGEGAYGAQAAAETYFGTTAADLTLPQSALIAGLAQSPSGLDPYSNPTGAIRRRGEVLERMLLNHYISQAEYAAAVAAPVELRDAEPRDGIYADPYFVSYVKALLQQQFSSATVFQGGLSVHTTLDTKLQAEAEASAYHTFKRPSDPEVALVAIDPQTGWVKAMVGGRDWARSEFNLATQAHRQAGSAFKTFVLVTALSQGMPPSFQVDSSAPAVIPSKPKPWIVRNNEGSGAGMMPLDVATWDSVNTVFARVAWAVGIGNVATTAESMGITTRLPDYPSIALGSTGVTPLEMASAYSTLPSGGVYRAPVAIASVTDGDGNVIYEDQPEAELSVLRPVAHAAIDVLKGVIARGTGTAAGIGRPEAGKTGTSQGNRDCWFVGFTPQLCTAVWVGYPKERTVVVDGARGFGGTVAAPIWARFMRKALSGKPREEFFDAPEPAYDADAFDLSGDPYANP